MNAVLLGIDSVKNGRPTWLLISRLLEEIDADMFACKGTELRDRIAQWVLQVEARDRGRSEQADLAIKCF